MRRSTVNNARRTVVVGTRLVSGPPQRQNAILCIALRPRFAPLTEPNHDILPRYSAHNTSCLSCPGTRYSKTVRPSPLQSGYRRIRYPQVNAPRPRPTASAFRVLRPFSATTCVEPSFSAVVSRLDERDIAHGPPTPSKSAISARSLGVSLSPRPSGYDPDCPVMTRVSLPHNPGRGLKTGDPRVMGSWDSQALRQGQRGIGPGTCIRPGTRMSVICR